MWGTAPPIIPHMETGATDGLFLRTAGIPVYGVSGISFDPDDMRAHGKDERILVKSFNEGLEFAYQLVRAIGSKPHRQGSDSGVLLDEDGADIKHGKAESLHVLVDFDRLRRDDRDIAAAPCGVEQGDAGEAPFAPLVGDARAALPALRAGRRLRES